MSNRALALKFRPQGFGEVVGQEITVRVLQNALREKKIHHAYLFAGPRGIGKTSLARIVAKAVNCEGGPATEPCNQCVSCREITEGRSLSVIEIDGASNTSVEDVRELRDKVRYLPAGGRYKIYIIDEVHMLSTAAFNALLKTLEEPPSHVLFLFATTEPQKVPGTVLSRVLRFDLRPIPTGLVVAQLKKISEAERIQADEAALFQIARDAGGGLRDAVGLLDQTAALTGARVDVAGVESILGVSPQRFLPDLLRAILGQDSSQALEILGKAHSSGLDVKRLATSLLEYFRHLLVAGTSRGDTTLFDLPPEEIETIHSLSRQSKPEAIDWLFQLTQHALPDLLRSSHAKILFDVLVLRLCRSESIESLGEILKRLDGIGGSGGQPAIPIPQPKKETPSLFNAEPPPPKPSLGWKDFLASLKSTKPQIASIVSEGSLVDLGERELIIGFPEKSLHREMLAEAERMNLLRELARSFFGRPINIRLENLTTATAPQASGSKTVVDDAINIFQPRTTKAVPPELR